MCHGWLGSKYGDRSLLAACSPKVQQFMVAWSMRHPSVADMNSFDMQRQIDCMAYSGEEEKAMVGLLYCRTQIAMLCHKCQMFGQALLATPLPAELLVLATEVINEVSESWLKSAAPVVAAGDQASEEYRKSCQFMLESSCKFEIQQGCDIMLLPKYRL